MNSVMKRNSAAPSMFGKFWAPDFFRSFFDYDMDSVPAMNVTEKAKEYVVDLSVPGFDKKDVTVEVDNNILNISGQTKTESQDKDSEDRIVRREFASSSFERSFVLPDNIDTAQISAKQDKGVLKISLPKRKGAPEDKTTKITIA